MIKTIIISPSGHLYGSENVLFDFLKGSTLTYKIYVPEGSLFFEKLNRSGFQSIGFNNLKLLYFKIFLQLFLQKRNLILNESGHIKYVKLLAKLLPKRKFVVIIRLLEDCNANLYDLPNNIQLIAVSNFIKNNVVSNRPVHVIYDPFELTEIKTLEKNVKSDRISVGVIGRLIESKGLNHFIDLINLLTPDQKDCYKFLFFGTYDNTNVWFQNFKSALEHNPDLSYQFMGFENDQSKLYCSCDVILHLNKNEALGRILFEAINYELPFLCFRQGGTGELASELGFESNTFDNVNEIPGKLDEVATSIYSDKIENAITFIQVWFSPEKYAQQLEKFL